MKRKIQILLLLLTFLSLFSLTAIKVQAVDYNAAVNIPDPNLKQAILKELNKNSNYVITVKDMENISSLYIGSKNIQNLTGLEYCTNITELNLNKNNITNLSPLSNLTKLNFLNLSDNNISDIYPLARLTNLRTLWIGGNKIFNISPLLSMTLLEQLDLSKNEISDISPLSRLTNLELVHLHDNHIYDLSPIANLKKLYNFNNMHQNTFSGQTIDLPTEYNPSPYRPFQMANPIKGQFGEAIANIDSISDQGYYSNETNSINWTRLMNDTTISFNFSTKVTFTKNSEAASIFSGRVKRPVILNPQINIPDENLRNVIYETLGKSKNYPITKKDLESITTIEAESRNISSLSGLQYCINLNKLNLANNNISSVEPLKNLHHLFNLNLSSNHICDITPLEDFQDKIFVFDNQTLQINDAATDNTFEIKNIIKVLDLSKNKHVASEFNINNISSGGKFNKESNTLSWESIPYTSSVQYSFRFFVRSDFGRFFFTGTVTKPVKFEIINIPDNNLKKAVQKAVGKDSTYTNITKKALQSITKLDAEDLNITDLSGLEYCTNLKELNLNNNKITDISPLKTLTNLEKISLANQQINLSEEYYQNSYELPNSIKNLNGLAMSNVTSISNNGIYNPDTNKITWSNINKDVTVSYTVAENINIGYASGNYSAAISKPLLYNKTIEITDENLRKTILKKLKKDNDYTLTLENMKSITSLSASDSNITDLTGLNYCTNLKGLILDSNNISDLTPLSKLTNLTTLSLNNNNISDIYPLKNLTKLIRASICNQNIVLPIEYYIDEASIKNTLKVDKNTYVNKFSDFAVDGHYDEKCNTLFFDLNNSDADVSYNFSYFKHTFNNFGWQFSGTVKKSFLYNNVVTFEDNNLKSFIYRTLNKAPEETIYKKDLANIKDLNVSNMQIKSIAGIEYMSHLKNLNISNNEITDISNLKKIAGLENVDASNQNIVTKPQKYSTRYINVNIDNPFISYNGVPIINFTYISDNGQYSSKSNKVIWRKLSENSTLSFEFEENTSLSNKGSCLFSGKISKEINFK